MNQRQQEFKDYSQYRLNWVIKWGITIVSIIFFGFLFFAQSIRTLDVIKPLNCTVLYPIQRVSRNTPIIKRNILVKDGDFVAKGTYILTLDTNTNILDLRALKKLVVLSNLYLQNPEAEVLDFNSVNGENLGPLRNGYLNLKMKYRVLDSLLEINNYRRIKDSDRINKVYSETLFALKELEKNIIEWEDKNIIKSSIEGIISISEEINSDSKQVFEIKVNSSETASNSLCPKVKFEIDSIYLAKILSSPERTIIINIDNTHYTYSHFNIDPSSCLTRNGYTIISAKLNASEEFEIPYSVLEEGCIKCSAELRVKGKSILAKIFSKYSDISNIVNNN